MKITHLFLGNRHAVWAMVVAILFLGTVGYLQIPVRLFPDTAPPLVNVVTAWPGANATDVNQDLTEVIETELASLEGVASTRSTSQDNLSRITVEFQYGTDVRMAAVDVQNAIARIGDDLPEGANQPRVMTFSTADRPIYTVGVVADDLLEARRLAEEVIAPRLQAVNGVAAIDVFGGHVPALLVDVDPTLAEAHHLSLQQVVQTIQTHQLSLPAGRLRGDRTDTMLRVDTQAERADELADLPVTLPDGGQLRLGNVATIYRGSERDDAWFSIDGTPAIAVQVYRSEDANTVAVVDAVEEVVAQLEEELPSLTFLPGEESASFTEQSVSNLLSNVWQALALASLLLFLFLGRARAAMITAFTMPLSFGLTFAVMWWLGMEFNLVTLSAVILAVGMVVDASVVVLENIVRLRDEGLSAEEAAREGTDQVVLPVLAGVATTLVVLVPLLSLPGFVGKVFGPLAGTLLIAFSSSVIVALVLVPILSLSVGEGGRLERGAATLAKPFQRAMEALGNLYLKVLDRGLRWRWAVVLVALLSFVSGVAGLVQAGMDVLPRMDSGAYSVSLETPSGSSLERTTAVIQAVERAIAEEPNVTLIQSQAGYEPGMKFTGGSGIMGPTQGFISVTLTPRTERSRSVWEIQEALRTAIDRIPGITNVVVKEVGNTAKPTTAAPLVVRLSGPDPLVLDTLGDEVVARLQTVDAVRSPTRGWRRDLERVVLDVEPRTASALGQSALTVARQLASGAEGIPAGTWRTPEGSTEPIEVRYARSDDPELEEMLRWPAFLRSGDIVPIGAVVRSEKRIEQGLFTSEDTRPVLDVLAQIDGRPLSKVVADTERAMEDLSLPEGYTLSIEGENHDLMESRSSILRALGASVVAVYLLLVAQFRSWMHPITVMMAVPLSLAGVSAALTIAGQPISMPVMVGLVLLVGTVVNNSILLIDVIRQHREEGMPRRDAIREGVRVRFRPIMMTSLSTVIGMIPLAAEWALGAERFSPLATAVIGGLLASTLLTLIVIPVLYDLADGLRLPWRGAPAAAALVLVMFAPGIARATPVELDEAWNMTLEHPAVRAAALQHDAARAQARAATSRLLPQVELQARYSALSEVDPPLVQIPLTLPDGSSPDPIQLGEVIVEQTSLTASLTQPIFTGGAIHAGRRAAREGARAAEANETQVRSELWLNLVRTYHGRALAEQTADLLGEVVEAARAREASVQRQLEAGRTTEVELARVALERAEAEQRYDEALRKAKVAAEGLETLLQRPVELPTYDMVALARQAMEAAPPTGTAPSVQEAEARAEAARAKARASSGAALPRVALRMGYQHANPNMRYFPVRKEWNSTWDASVVATWTLDPRRIHEARSANRSSLAARAGFEAEQRRVELARREASATVDGAPRQLEVAAERVRLAERALVATRHALERGRATPSALMAREAALAQARAAELKAAYDILVAVETARTLAGHYGPHR